MYYRQDNAGCYHSALTIFCAKHVADRNGVIIERSVFSDPWGGKGPCDRKSANIKCHITSFLNSGKDAETVPETVAQMKTAMQPLGRIPGVRVSLCVPPYPFSDTVELSGVSFFNNVSYEEQGMRVWRTYGIGPGKLLSWKCFSVPKADCLPTLTVTDGLNGPAAPFTTVTPRRTADNTHTSNKPESDVVNSSKLFSCPEEGCVMSTQRHSAPQHHLDCGRHTRALEQETLLDKVMVGYSVMLEAGMSTVPEGGLDRDPHGESWRLRSRTC